MVRAGAIIVLVAALAIAAVGIWLVRSAAPPPQSRAHASAAHVPEIAHGPTGSSNAAVPATSTSATTAPPAPAQVASGASAASDTSASTSPSAATAPVGGLASSREHALTDASPENAPHEESADAKTATSTSDGDASSTESADAPIDNGEDASAPADDADTGAANGKPESIDDNHAADLLADWIASQDAASADAGENTDANGSSAVQQAWKTFDQEDTDTDWSQSTEKQIEDTLDQWLAGLPDAVRDHVDVIHVECRETLCQILAADNDLATQSQRANDAQEWQQAIATLPQQPWWHELGFVDFSTSVSSNADSGYALYQTYLRREVTPSE